MARDEKCNGCQFALHSVPMSQSSCWACKDHSAYTPEPTLPPSPDEDFFEEMYRKVHGDVEAHPENYDDMFAGYENNPAKALALVDWQNDRIKSLEMTVKILGEMLGAKQSEGEWEIKSEIYRMFDDVDEEIYVECSLCQRRFYVPYELDDEKIFKYAREHYPYCNCGAKMKGGAE